MWERALVSCGLELRRCAGGGVENANLYFEKKGANEQNIYRISRPSAF